MNIIEKHLTGSRYWGGHTDDSDYDYMVLVSGEDYPDEDTIDYDENILRNTVSFKTYDDEGDELNYICYEDKDVYDKAVVASEMMMLLAQTRTLTKYDRHRTFESIINSVFITQVPDDDELFPW